MDIKESDKNEEKFQPYTVEIKIETEKEEETLFHFCKLDVTIPKIVAKKRFDNNLSYKDIVNEFMTKLHSVIFDKRIN